MIITKTSIEKQSSTYNLKNEAYFTNTVNSEVDLVNNKTIEISDDDYEVEITNEPMYIDLKKIKFIHVFCYLKTTVEVETPDPVKFKIDIDNVFLTQTSQFQLLNLEDFDSIIKLYDFVIPTDSVVVLNVVIGSMK